ncbi:MAG: DUF3592 domain-containing protein [Planctomycetota bacterium]|nr:DUF3592 domain-containing protein [Planctomycetota bacterium]
MAKTRKRSALGFLLFFALFWCGLTGVFDGFIAHTIYRQSRAESFPTTTGLVSGAEITSETSTDSDGHSSTTYRAEISFRYDVDGRTYASDTYRYGAMGSSDRSYAESVAQRYPVDSEVTVHYNPRDPSDAVLETGVGGMEMFLILFLTPFNLVGLWLLAMVGGSIRRRMTRPPAGGVPLVQRGGITHARLPRFSPLTTAGATALGLSFISIFIVGFGTGMDPPPWVIWTVWGVVLIPAIVVYFWRTFLVGSGAKDLVIDEDSRTLSLPQTFGRKVDIIVPFDAVTELDVEEIIHRSSKGGTSYTYAPRLIRTDEEGATHREKLADWHDQQRADGFIAWLKDRLGR